MHVVYDCYFIFLIPEVILLCTIQFFPGFIRNPKQPFSQADDHEQFCYRAGDRFCGFSNFLLLNAQPRFW